MIRLLLFVVVCALLLLGGYLIGNPCTNVTNAPSLAEFAWHVKNIPWDLNHLHNIAWTKHEALVTYCDSRSL